MALPGNRTAGLVVALLANGAFAMGLGEASGRAVLGLPLHLEIPVTGGTPAQNCFRLRAPRTQVGNDFAVRHARVEVAGGKLRITTTAALTEPVLGFTLEGSCAGVSREYVLLVALPVAPQPVAFVEPPRTATAAPPVSAAATPVSAAPAAGPVTAPAAAVRTAPVAAAGTSPDMLRIAAPLTLEALAREKYPLQPKAREKFMRMMIAANPELISIGTPIAAGTELRLPPGLPLRRTGPYLGEGKTAAPKSPAVTETRPERPATTPPVARQNAAPKSKDRLVLGRAPEPSKAVLLSETERLTSILLDQTRAQLAMTASLENMEADYAELRRQFLAMQAQLARAEAQRAAERQAATEAAKRLQLAELLAAVLGGGAIGGIALHLFQRHRLRKETEDYPELTDVSVPAAGSERTPPPARAMPKLDFHRTRLPRDARAMTLDIRKP